MSANPILRGSLLAIAAAVAFGIATPLVQKLGVGADPLATAMLLYAGAALASMRWSSPKAQAPSLGRQHVLRLLAVALVGAVIAPTFLAWGLQHTSGTTGSLLLNTEAGFTVVLGWRLYHEPIGRRLVLALAIMTAGGACLVAFQPNGSWGLGWGALVVLAAALCWATDNALTRPLADLDAVQVVRLKSALGAAVTLVLSLVIGQRFPSWRAAAGLLACGATGYGLSLRWYLLAQRQLGAGRTSSIFALAPFVGAVVAWGLRERGDPVATLVAAALFGLGIYLHATEKHGHRHRHEAVEHEHAHRHDDEHHDHEHSPPFAGEHSHQHRHEAAEHEHAHGGDLHHQHRHG